MIESARGVCDEVAREHVDAGITAPAAGHERRKLFVVSPRQVSANLEELRANDVVIVAQPFFGGGLRRFGESLFRELSVDLLELRGIPLEASQQLAPRPAAGSCYMLRRQLTRVRFELIERQRRAPAFEVVVCIRRRAAG